MMVQNIPNGFKFLVEPLECGGYLFALEKTITIKENQLQIDYWLANRGERAIRTTEYCHNFIGIDGQPVGADYKLELSYPLQLVPAPDGLKTQEPLLVNDREMSWKFKPETDFYGRLKDVSLEQPHKWTIRHQSSQTEVTEESFFTPLRVALWGKGHVISPAFPAHCHHREAIPHGGLDRSWCSVWTGTWGNFWG